MNDRDVPRFRAPADGIPDAGMRAAFMRDGFLVLTEYTTPARCAALIGRAGEIVDGFDAAADAAVFSTRSHAHAANDRFLASAREVQCFLEEGARGDDGRLRQDKVRSVNKIGHALHVHDPIFAAFSNEPRITSLGHGLGLARPRPIQSMYIFKPPRIGGEVVWHQDATFLLTEPSSVIGLWLALEDATVENGCLWAAPGSHSGPLRRRFRNAGGALVFDELDPAPWPEADALPLEVPAGTLIALHGHLPHASAPNRSARSRHAYSLHLVDAACEYRDDNWLIPE